MNVNYHLHKKISEALIDVKILKQKVRRPKTRASAYDDLTDAVMVLYHLLDEASIEDLEHLAWR